MATIFEIGFGICGGLVIIAGVTWLAFKPYLAHPARKSRLPEAIEQPDNTYGGANLGS